MTAVFSQKKGSHLFLAFNKQNNMHTTLPQTHIELIMPRPKGIGSCHTHDNQCFNCKDIHSNSNELSSLVIPVTPPLNTSVINPPHLYLVCQQSSRSSHNTISESQASSIPGRASADPSNTMPPPSTKNRSRNIYGCMVDVSKLTPEQRQHHATMLLQNYHGLCNTNDPSSMFISPPPMTNIESLSQSTIPSLFIGSFVRNIPGVNIQQQTISEVADS